MNKKVTCYIVGLRLAVFVFAMIIVSAWQPVYAQEQNFACAEEIEQYCKDVKPGGGRLLACLKEHESDLSPTCREKVAELEKMIKEAVQTCAADIERYCKGIQPGEGRIAKCLKEHIEEISPDCREKVHGIRKMEPANKASGPQPD